MAAAPEETAGEAERDAGAAPVSQDGGRQHLSCALCISGSPPAPSQMGTDSLAAAGYSEGGGAGGSICIGPSVNTRFLQVISRCGPVLVNAAWQLTAWILLSSHGGGAREGGGHRW